MWKRNVAVGLTVFLTALTVCLGVVNSKQQVRIDALEKVRNTTTEQVETEIQRYLNSNAFRLFGEATDETGVDMESLINDSIGEVIEQTDEGYLVSVKLSEEQSQAIASEVASMAYDTLTDKVLDGSSSIDTQKLEKEVAQAVTTQLATYIDSQDKEYVTIEGDTSAIVAQIIAELKASGDLNTSLDSGQDTIQSTPGMTQEQIESLVKQLVSGSSVTSESIESYQSALVTQTIEYLRKYNLLSQGKDGINGKDGKDAVTPVFGEDYFTDEEISRMSSEIMEAVTTLLANEGLSVYGTRGYGISASSLDENTGEVTLYLTDDGETTDDPNDLGDDVKEINLGAIDGNSICYLDIRNDGNETFTLRYFMDYRLNENDNAPIYKLTKQSSGSAYAVEEFSGNSKPENSDPSVRYAFMYEAGTLSLDSTQISKIVAAAESEIISSLETQLGSDIRNVQDTLTDLQKSVDRLDIYINGGTIENENGTMTQVQGIGSFADGASTDAGGNITYAEGSLGWVADKITGQSGNLESVLDLADEVTGLGNLTQATDGIKIDLSILDRTNTSGYAVWSHTIDSCVNKDADFVWVKNEDADSIPTSGQGKNIAYAKYAEVTTNDNGTADVKVYFDKAVPDSGELFIQFQNTGLVNPGTGITNNNVIDDYNVVRQTGEGMNGTQKYVTFEGGRTTDTSGQKIIRIVTD